MILQGSRISRSGVPALQPAVTDSQPPWRPTGARPLSTAARAHARVRCPGELAGLPTTPGRPQTPRARLPRALVVLWVPKLIRLLMRNRGLLPALFFSRRRRSSQRRLYHARTGVGGFAHFAPYGGVIPPSCTILRTILTNSPTPDTMVPSVPTLNAVQARIGAARLKHSREDGQEHARA